MDKIEDELMKLFEHYTKQTEEYKWGTTERACAEVCLNLCSHLINQINLERIKSKERKCDHDVESFSGHCRKCHELVNLAE